jgi:hypothetical protein
MVLDGGGAGEGEGYGHLRDFSIFNSHSEESGVI